MPLHQKCGRTFQVITEGQKAHKKTPETDAGRNRRPSGLWTKYTSSNTVRAVECGSRRKSKTRLSTITRPGEAWDTSAPCGSGRATFSADAKRAGSMAKPLGSSSNFCMQPAPREGRRVVVISDNAKYHHSFLKEQHAAKFALDYLPPYSPELNPIERVWELTRRLCLHNRYFRLPRNPHRRRRKPVLGMNKTQRYAPSPIRNHLRRYV